jgi:hypothetical protein
LGSKIVAYDVAYCIMTRKKFSTRVPDYLWMCRISELSSSG